MSEMSQWEYKTIRYEINEDDRESPRDAWKELVESGQEGWELVSVVVEPRKNVPLGEYVLGTERPVLEYWLVMYLKRRIER